MKIINNNYKIEENLYTDFFVEAYRVTDIKDSNKSKFLKLYYSNLQQDFIDYLIENQFRIKAIKHKSLLKSEEFNIIKTVDTDETTSLMYYSISEYVQFTSLAKNLSLLNFNKRIKVLLDLIMVVDHLHFKGFSYNFLTPMRICLTNEKEIKLESLFSILEKSFTSEISQFEAQFISPDFLSQNVTSGNSLDYYSLAKIIEYLFLDDESIYENLTYSYKTEEIKDLFSKLIHNLENRDSKDSEVNLINIVDKIVSFFNLDFKYDLIKERDFIYPNSPVIVRKKEIAKVMDFDQRFAKRENLSNLILIDGDEGIGRDRFLSEVKYRLDLKGRSVYLTNISLETDSEYSMLVDLLQQMDKNTSNNLKEKYKNEISLFINDLKKEGKKDFFTDKFYSEKFRFYNRMASYLKDLAASKPIYILVNNIQNSSEDFLTMLDYLVGYFKNSQVVCVFAYNSNILSANENLSLAKNNWINNCNGLLILLQRFNLKEGIDLVKNTLGIGKASPKYAQYLINESGGKPEEIIKIISYLYTEGYLYMDKSGKWMLDVADDSKLIIPSFGDELVVEKLKMLDKKFQQPLKILSCFSEFAPLSILESLCKEKDKLEELSTYLLEANIIEKKQLDFEPGYSFNSIQLNKRIYSEITEEEKLDLHTKIVEILKNYEIAHHSSMFKELIFQLVKSNQGDRAVIHIINKVDLLDNKSGSQAKSLLEQAYKILPTIDNIEIILEVYQRVLYIELLTGKLDKDNKRFIKYCNLAKKHQAYMHILHAKMFLAELHYQQDDKQAFIDQIKQVRELNKDYKLVYFEAYCLTIMSNIQIATQDYDEAEKALRQALSLAKTHSLKDQLGNIYNMLGVIEYLKGRYKSAIKYFEKSYEAFLLDKDIMRANKPVNNLGNIYVTYFNDLDQAQISYQKGLDISKKHGLEKMEIVFNVNLSEVYREKYDFKKALEYIKEANRIAILTADNHKLAIAQNLMGGIYLELKDYSKAYECFMYERDLYTQIKVSDFQLSLAYYGFSGKFYYSFGMWDKSFYYLEKSKELYKAIDKRHYYKTKFKLLSGNYIKGDGQAKEELDKFIRDYSETIYVENYREAILTLALLNLHQNNKDGALKYLHYDDKVKDRVNINFLNKLRLQADLLLNLSKDNLSVSVATYELELIQESSYFHTMILSKIADLYSEKNNPAEAIRYYIKALEVIYRNTVKILGWDLKISYLKSRGSDSIKENLEKVIKDNYNLQIESTRLDSFSEKEDFTALNKYFDFESFLAIFGKERYSKLVKGPYSNEVLGINSINDLMSKFSENNSYNLDLLINFIAKETLASRASIVIFNEKKNQINTISTINPGKLINYNINDRVFKLAARTNNGLLAKYDFDDYSKKLDSKLIKEKMAATICVPIRTNSNVYRQGLAFDEDNYLDNIIGFIFLESESVFNDFSQETLKLINSLAYLVYQNIEMQKLKLLATTDKLTGALTRKHYEKKFNELINEKKTKVNQFSFLMLDLDRFKKINDNYGHQKGDDVLSRVSMEIKRSIRGFDIFARYGGEEFIIILKNTDEKDAIKIAENIRSNVEKLKIEGIKNPLTISIGISHYPSHSKFKDDLLQKADQALYHAKQHGRNRVFLWNNEIDNVFERADKLAGIITGVSEVDNKNVLGIVQTAHLIENKASFKEKVFTYLGELINLVESEKATLLILDNQKEIYFTRDHYSEGFSKSPVINEELLKTTKNSKIGQFLIDWESSNNNHQAFMAPNWNSVIIIPMIKNGQVLAITYLTSPLSEKEFNFNDFNLAKTLASIFTSVL